MDISNYFLYEESKINIDGVTPNDGYFGNLEPVLEDATDYWHYDFYNETIDEGDDDDDGDDDKDKDKDKEKPKEDVLTTTDAPEAPLQPIKANEEATMASAVLPFTGGNPMAFVYAGFALAGLGTVLRRKFR